MVRTIATMIHDTRQQVGPAELAGVLQDPIAQELLHSTIPARLAYIAQGAPRVVPM